VAGIRHRVPLRARVRARHVLGRLRWGIDGYPVPAPQHVKLHVLRRHGYADGTWVETGTFVGDSTAVLARRASRVFTIEPSRSLAASARHRFADNQTVTVIEGLSEDVLGPLLEHLTGTVSFWLDGHASGGPTFSGPQVTPIRQELSTIGAHVDRWDRVSVLVDDFRGFSSTAQADEHYPPKSYLVSWADQHGLAWTVEHDIFIARR